MRYQEEYEKALSEGFPPPEAHKVAKAKAGIPGERPRPKVRPSQEEDLFRAKHRRTDPSDVLRRC